MEWAFHTSKVPLGKTVCGFVAKVHLGHFAKDFEPHCKLVNLNNLSHIMGKPTMWFLYRTVTNRVVQTQKHKHGADWCRDRVVDSGPRGPGFNPQPGCLSLWP